MSSKEWVLCNYTEKSQVPQLGEIIKIPLSLTSIEFKCGPNSDYTPSSHSSAVSAKTSQSKTSANRNKSKQGGSEHGPSHLILVVNVYHSQKKKTINIEYFPIAAYSSRSKAKFTDGQWDPDRWMREATPIQQIHHIPVPAANWTPIYPPDAPLLTFGSWKNTRPAWVMMSLNEMTISEDDKWNRHCDGPVILDGERGSSSALYNYYRHVIPEFLTDAGTTLSTSNLPRNNNPTIMKDIVLDCHHLWATISPYGLYETHLIFNDNSTTEEEHLDGPDPTLFWNFPESSKEYRGSEEKQQKATLIDAISKWQNQCLSEGIKEFPVENDAENEWEDKSAAVLEDVDALDITSAEESCDGDDSQILE